MIKYYCGNNANNPSLLDGSKVLGTKLQCLKRGLRRGLSEPVDPLFLEPYQPIDPIKKYCGDKENLPENYDRFGGLYECYLKGVGTGKRLKAQRNLNGNNNESELSDVEGYAFNNKNKNNKKDRLFFIFIVNIAILCFIYLFFPRLIYEKIYDENFEKGKIIIKWFNIFVIILSLFLISLNFILL